MVRFATGGRVRLATRLATSSVVRSWVLQIIGVIVIGADFVGVQVGNVGIVVNTVNIIKEVRVVNRPEVNRIPANGPYFTHFFMY